MIVNSKNNREFKRLLKTAHFKETLNYQDKPHKVPFLQLVTGCSRTYVFAWLADKDSQSYLEMPDHALRLFKLELGFSEPRYAEE